MNGRQTDPSRWAAAGAVLGVICLGRILEVWPAAATPAAGGHPDERPSPVSAPGDLPPADSYFADAAKVIAEYWSLPTPPKSELRDALAHGAIDLLRAESDGEANIESQPVLARLQMGLGRLGPPEMGRPDVLGVHVANRDGQSEDLVLFTVNLSDPPVIAIHRVGSTYRVIGWDRNGPYGNSLRAVDVTGDGVKDIVAGYSDGGSGGGLHIEVLRWVAKTHDFKRIFLADLGGWVGGPCEYRIVPGGRRNDIEVRLPIVGIFDGRGPDHRAKKELWSYDRAKDRFVRRRRTIEPPTTARQALNEAEDLFRRGELTAAVTSYHRAWSDTSLHDDYPLANADCRGFARFREGQVLAVLGREANARAALDDAIGHGGGIAALATAFRANYTGPDGAARAWSTLPSLDAVIPTPSEAQGTNLPGGDILYLGEAMVAYLTAHPDAAATPGAVFETLRGWGLDTLLATAIDLDGDGTNEFLFQAAKDHGHSYWVVYRSHGRWLADDSVHKQIGAVGGLVSLARGHAVEPMVGPNAPRGAGGELRGLTLTDGHLRWVDKRSLQLVGTMGTTEEWPSCDSEDFSRLQ